MVRCLAMNETQARYSDVRRRPKAWLIAVIVLLHIGLFYLLVRAFAPGAVATVERSVVSAFTVSITAPEPDPPPQEPEPAGAAGNAGREAVPDAVTAPEPRRPLRQDKPAPKAASTGSADTAGATDAGEGTGRSGQGAGTGSGAGGYGTGGGAPSKPVLSRSITDASAFPVPPGGRQARIGKSVIVRLSVSPEGRVTGCSIYRPSPFPETDAVVCQLAYEQIRFEPARDGRGNPVSATFLYRQSFFN